MKQEVVLGNVMVDCDGELRLQTFYGDLLGWEKCMHFERPGVCSAAGAAFLSASLLPV